MAQRDIREVRQEADETDKQYMELSKKLRLVTQERLNVEEELLSSNVRMKQLLGELNLVRDSAQVQALAALEDSNNKMSMGELSRQVESTLMTVLDQRCRDETFTSALAEHRLTSTEKVRVEFGGDEVFWSLHDNHTIKMLHEDASRYWDVEPEHTILVDEKGAIWPSEAYVGLELQRAPNARIALQMDPLIAPRSADLDMNTLDGESTDEEDEEFDPTLFQFASPAAEDELLRAQANGTMNSLTQQQKLALRRKLKVELYWFIAFVSIVALSLWTRRTVKDANRMRNAISHSLLDSKFGSYNEKAFSSIATSDDLFDWMEGPLLDHLYPEMLYNDRPVPANRTGYVMAFNRVMGKVRLRQLRVHPDAACELSAAIRQPGEVSSGKVRRRQFVDYCFGPYSEAAASNASFGADATLRETPGSGFVWSSREVNVKYMHPNDKLMVEGELGEYDASGFVRDIDPSARDLYATAVDELRSNLWLDEQTRAVIISLNLYNGNYDFYCISKFLVEFTPGGSLVPTATNSVMSMDTYRIEDLQRVNDILARYAPEALTYVGGWAYLLALLYRAYRTRRVTGSFRGFLRDYWNWVDLFMILNISITFWLRVAFYYASTEIGPWQSPNEYVEMAPLAHHYTVICFLDSLTIFLITVKALKYFALQKDMMLLQKTLVQALQDLVMFAFILIAILSVFVIAGHSIFGANASGFKTVQDTIGALFLILLGEFDYEEVREVNEGWAFIFYTMFIVSICFVIVNIFLAILNDAYMVVRTNAISDELEKRQPVSLNEKFEVRKALWRERQSVAHMQLKKLKKEKRRVAKTAMKVVKANSTERA